MRSGGPQTLYVQEIGASEKSTKGLRAALCCRLAPGFSRAPNSGQLSRRLVAEGMAQAIFVPQTQSYILACYPCEPFLARGAYNIMRKASSSEKLDVLIAFSDNSMIDRGPRGELVTKFVFMSAFDECAEDIDSLPADSLSGPPQSTVQLLPVATLESLLKMVAHGAGVDWSGILDSDPFSSSPASSSPLRRFANYTTVFGQFIVVKDLDPKATTGESSTSTFTLMQQALRLQIAIECAPNNPLVDFWLVFALHRQLLAVGIQTKNREIQWDPTSLSGNVFEHLRTIGIPVLYIVHDIMATKAPSFSLQKIDRTANPRASSRKTWAPLYVLVLTGLPSQYVDHNKLTQLLRSQTKPFVDAGEVSEQHILQMGATLTSHTEAAKCMWGSGAEFGQLDEQGTFKF